VADDPAGALARATLGAYLRVRPGEPVTIETWSTALAWARALVVEARRMRTEPLLAVEDEEGFFRSLGSGGRVPTAPVGLAGFGGAYVYLPGPEAFPRLLGLRADDLRPALERHGASWRAAAVRSRLRAVRLGIATVTNPAAARYGVDVDAWREEVLRASLVPPNVLDRGARWLARRLSRARRATVRHPNGTSLRIDLRAGHYEEMTGCRSSPGEAIWCDVPTGRVGRGVRSPSVGGSWEANRPAYDRLGDTPVALGANFAFERGALAAVSFDRGGESFVSDYGVRPRRSLAVTGLSVGVNPYVHRAPEIGDLEDGTIGLHLAGTERTAGGTRRRAAFVSLLHGADLDLDETPVLVGGRPIRAKRRTG
jgi:hypothetical protein